MDRRVFDTRILKIDVCRLGVCAPRNTHHLCGSRGVSGAQRRPGALKRAEGVQLGRPREMSSETVEKFQNYYESGLSVVPIARRLNEDGVPTPRRGRWHSPGVKRALSWSSDEAGGKTRIIDSRLDLRSSSSVYLYLPFPGCALCVRPETRDDLSVVCQPRRTDLPTDFNRSSPKPSALLPRICSRRLSASCECGPRLLTGHFSLPRLRRLVRLLACYGQPPRCLPGSTFRPSPLSGFHTGSQSEAPYTERASPAAAATKMSTARHRLGTTPKGDSRRNY